MADAGPGGGSGEILWPARLKRTPVRVLWFDRIRALPAGLDLQAIADRFAVGKTTAHMWVNTFGYATRDGRGGPAKKRTPAAPAPAQSAAEPGLSNRSQPPPSLERVGSFDAVAEDGSRHIVFVYQPADDMSGKTAAQPPVLLTSFDERIFRLSKGVYQFVATGKRLISRDSHAP